MVNRYAQKTSLISSNDPFTYSSWDSSGEELIITASGCIVFGTRKYSCMVQKALELGIPWIEVDAPNLIAHL